MASGKKTKPKMVVVPEPHPWGRDEGRPDVDRHHGLSRVNRAFYQNIPGTSVTYYKNEFDAVFVNTINTTTTLLRVDVPNDMVFDLVYVSFRFLIQSVDNVFVRAHDFFLSNYVVFNVRADGTNPFQQRNQFGAQLPQSGTRQLNGNIFDTDDDMKFHYVFDETRRLTFDYTVVTGGLDVPALSQCGVEVRGIWVPQSVWNDMKEDLR